jgi:NAD(P)-dependent dehydrogenase (short-subunit alcohol dehydrogenase family)
MTAPKGADRPGESEPRASETGHPRPDPSTRFDTKTAIITGGTRGIGLAIATLLAEGGASVVVAGRDETRVKTAVAELEALGRPVLGVVADVARREDADRLVEATRERFGRVDILVNNVGRSRYAKIWEMSVEDWDFAIHVNLRAAFLCTRAAVHHMMRQRSGRIVCISSAAKDGSPWNAYYRGCSGYATAKAGIHGFIRDLALELAEHGINVNEVSPGPIETERAAPHLHELNRTVERSPNRMTPLRRLGQPIEIASAVLFLASPEASYITGHTLSVAGGL